MRLKVVQAGEPVLRESAKALSPAEIQSRETQQLIEWMRETMHDAPGVGLAAPQIGLGLQLAVIEDRPENIRDAPKAFLEERERKPVPFHVVINPQITLDNSSEIEFFEGCLSLAGFTAIVARSRSVKVECLDHNARPQAIEASGWYARILQHEIDHLHGTLYIDRMLTRSFATLDNFNRHWKDKSMEEVKRLIGIE